MAKKRWCDACGGGGCIRCGMGVDTSPNLDLIVRDAYENFPEASESLRCVGWKYKEFRFKFVDDEDGKEHTVLIADAVRGLRLFIAAVDAGKLPGLGLSAGYLEDLGEWDAFAFDALNQMAIFGEVIYG